MREAVGTPKFHSGRWLTRLKIREDCVICQETAQVQSLHIVLLAQSFVFAGLLTIPINPFRLNSYFQSHYSSLMIYLFLGLLKKTNYSIQLHSFNLLLWNNYSECFWINIVLVCIMSQATVNLSQILSTKTCTILPWGLFLWLFFIFNVFVKKQIKKSVIFIDWFLEKNAYNCYFCSFCGIAVII